MKLLMVIDLIYIVVHARTYASNRHDLARETVWTLNNKNGTSYYGCVRNFLFVIILTAEYYYIGWHLQPSMITGNDPRSLLKV